MNAEKQSNHRSTQTNTDKPRLSWGLDEQDKDTANVRYGSIMLVKRLLHTVIHHGQHMRKRQVSGKDVVKFDRNPSVRGGVKPMVAAEGAETDIEKVLEKVHPRGDILHSR